MKYVFQFYRILLACLLGEVLAHVLPLPIPAGILSGVLVSLGGIAALAWPLKLDGAQAATLLPKSVTTAIGMDISAALVGRYK